MPLTTLRVHTVIFGNKDMVRRVQSYLYKLKLQPKAFKHILEVKRQMYIQALFQQSV